MSTENLYTPPAAKVDDMRTSITRSTKYLAWFAIINGIINITTPLVIPLFTSQSLPLLSNGILILLGVASSVAGFYGLKGKSWAFWLLFGTFLIQCVEYFSQHFYFSFIGAVELKIGWGWHSPPSHINLNILAIVVCILSVRTATRLSSPVFTKEMDSK
jgi:hypothetical protein